MIELDDCGKELLLGLQSYSDNYHQAEVRVQMVIKAPRGTLTLFDQNYIMVNAQCRAIKAFMKEHKNEAVCTRI